MDRNGRIALTIAIIFDIDLFEAYFLFIVGGGGELIDRSVCQVFVPKNV